MSESANAKPEVPVAEPGVDAGPPGRWSVGVSLAVAAALPVFVMFFLPWYRVLGGLDFSEPRVLTTVRGLDRAKGFDLLGQVLNTPIGYQQLGQGQQQPITPASLGVIRIETDIGDARPVLWLVPVLAAAVLGLGMLQALTQTRRVMSLALTACAAALAGLLMWEVGWFGTAAPAGPQAGGGYIVAAEPALPLQMSVWTAAGAVLCGIVALLFPGRRAPAQEATG